MESSGVSRKNVAEYAGVEGDTKYLWSLCREIGMGYHLVKASAMGQRTSSSESKRSERSDGGYFNRVWTGMLCFLLVLPLYCYCVYIACGMSILSCIIFVALDFVYLICLFVNLVCYILPF